MHRKWQGKVGQNYSRCTHAQKRTIYYNKPATEKIEPDTQVNRVPSSL
jgi:hypothetical protein